MPISRLLATTLAAAAITIGGDVAQAQDLGQPAAAMFDRVDANHDDVVTRDEIQAARNRMFDRLDTDRDELVTAAEIETARARFQERAAKRSARIAELRAQMPTQGERFAALDQNHDGFITRIEFVTADTPWFDRLDKSGQGISRADWTTFLDSAR